MKTKTTTFETKIKDTFIRYGRVPFLVVIAIAILSVSSYYAYSSIYRPYSIKKKVNTTINESITLLENSDIQEGGNIYQEIYKLRNVISDDLQVLLFDENLELLTITQPSLEGSAYLRIHNRVLLSQLLEDEWKTSVFTPLHTDESYLVYSGKKDNIYIMYFMTDLKGLDFLRNLSVDVMITDYYDNVFYSSNKDFINNVNKVNEDPMDGYDHSLKELDSSLRIHFFLKSNVYILMLAAVSAALFLTYALMQRLNEKSAKRIGEDFSYSIKLLHEAVKEMESGKINSRINITSDDEFRDLGEAFNVMNERLSELIDRNERLIMLNKDAEIKQLEAQFNPHFLYNTLETIRYLLNDDPKLASELIVKTTILLRYSINDTEEDKTFAHDLEYIKQYLEIHKMRLQDRFVYNIDIDDEVLKLNLPKLLIQPLIENSLKHGFQKQMSLELTITSYIFEGELYIYVIDDGGRMDPAKVEELNRYDFRNDNLQGYGIKSVIQRIKLMYGEDSTFRIHSDDRMTIIEIIIKEAYDEV